MPPPEEPVAAPSPWIRPPRQARSRETLERMLDAGETLLAARGFAGLRPAAVVEAAGCTIGAFYLRFRDKEGFLRALRERLVADMRARMAEQLVVDRWEGESLGRVLAIFVERLVEFIRAHRALLRAFLFRLAEDPEAWTPIRESAASMAAGSVRILLARRREIPHPDPELAIAFAIQGILGLMVNAILHDPGPIRLDDERLVPLLTEQFARALGLEPPAP